MRILVVLLLAAFVAAEQKREAGPEPGLPGYGYGLSPYRLSYGYGPAGIAYHPYGARSYSNFNLHSVHKREAEAAPEPEPGFLTGYGYGYPAATYGYGYSPIYNPYASSGYVHSYHHTLHKREADPGFLRGYGYGYPSLGAVYGYSTGVQHPGYGYSYQRKQGVVLPGYY